MMTTDFQSVRCGVQFVALLGLAALLSACGGSGGGTQEPDDPQEETAAPVISNLWVEGSPIHPGGQVQVFVSVDSASEASLSYSWDIPAGWEGTDSGTDVQVLTAPDEQAASAPVSVTVSDGEYTREAQVMVATRGPAIESWDMTLSGDEPLAPGESLEVSVNAFNRDGKPLTYHHSLGGARFDDTGPTWSHTLNPAMGGLYRVSSIVEDGDGLLASAEADIRVEGVSAWPGFGGDRQRSGRSLAPGATVGTGSQKWVFTAAGGHSSPALGADGTVYMGATDNNVYALDPADGSRIWSFRTGSVVLSSPAVGADGTVYVGSADNNVYALDPADGSELWSFSTGDTVFSSPSLGADGTVYVGSQDGNVYALDPDDGSELWSFATDDSVRSSPALAADGTVYVGSKDRNVYALDPADGSELWSFTAGVTVTSSPAVGADGTVYVGLSHSVYALDPADGSELWSFATDDSVRSSPALGAEGTVYVGSADNNVYALDPTDGSELWSHATGGPVESSPAVGADGTVYVGSNDNHVYALDPADGSELWSFTVGHWVRSSPALGADGTVYVGSDDNNVYAIE